MSASRPHKQDCVHARISLVRRQRISQRAIAHPLVQSLLRMHEWSRRPKCSALPGPRYKPCSATGTRQSAGRPPTSSGTASGSKWIQRSTCRCPAAKGSWHPESLNAPTSYLASGAINSVHVRPVQSGTGRSCCFKLSTPWSASEPTSPSRITRTGDGYGYLGGLIR